MLIKWAFCTAQKEMNTFPEILRLCNIENSGNISQSVLKVLVISPTPP